MHRGGREGCGAVQPFPCSLLGSPALAACGADGQGQLEHAWENLTQLRATAKAQGEGALCPGLGCHSTSWGYRSPTARAGAALGQGVTATSCPPSHTSSWAGHVRVPGSSPSLGAQRARSKGQDLGIGADGAARGSQELFINQPFPWEHFRVHLPPAPAGKRPHCAGAGWDRAGHSPTQWGRRWVRLWGPAWAARGTARGLGHAHPAQANATAPQRSRQEERPCPVLRHPAFPAPCCQGREEKPGWGHSITPCACLWGSLPPGSACRAWGSPRTAH